MLIDRNTSQIQAVLIPHPEFDRIALIDELERNARPTDNYAEEGLLDHHNPEVGTWLLHSLTDAIRQYTGEQVYPRNCYGRIVTHNAELIEHTDRDDIDWVVSVNVLRDAPSFLEIQIDDNWVAFNDAHGAILNRGNTFPHRRLPYQGQKAYQLILNYTRTEPARNFVIVKNVLDANDIRRIYDNLPQQTVRKGEVAGGKLTNARVSDVIWLEFEDERWLWLRRILCGVALEENAMRWKFDILASIKYGIQFTRYTKGQFYDWHSDTADDVSDNAYNRTLSMSVLLQNPISGGGFELRNGGVIPLEVGDAIVFPSSEEHRALAVTEGTREVLVVWFNKL